MEIQTEFCRKERRERALHSCAQTDFGLAVALKTEREREREREREKREGEGARKAEKKLR